MGRSNQECLRKNPGPPRKRSTIVKRPAKEEAGLPSQPLSPPAGSCLCSLQDRLPPRQAHTPRPPRSPPAWAGSCAPTAALVPPEADTSWLPMRRGGAEITAEAHGPCDLGSRAEISPHGCVNLGFIPPRPTLQIQCLWNIQTDKWCSHSWDGSGLSNCGLCGHVHAGAGLGWARV